MKARSRTLGMAGALAAVLAGLLAWAVVGVERPDEAARARHDRDSRALPFAAADVVGLVLAPRSGPEVRLARTPDGWRLLRPREGAADARAVGALLDGLLVLRIRTSLPAGAAAPPDSGLASPAVRVTVLLRDGSAPTLDLGDENPFDRARFASRDGRILLLTGVPEAALDPAPDRFAPGPGGG